MSQQTLRQFIAGEDLTGDEGLALYIDGSDSERVKVLGSAADDTFIGILVRGGADESIVDVATEGEVWAIAGAAVEPGDNLMVTTGGKLIPTATTGNRTVARYFPKAHWSGSAYSLPDSADTRKILVEIQYTRDVVPA